MRQNHIHGIVKDLMAKRPYVIKRLRIRCIGPVLRQARHKLIDIEGKVIVFITKMLIERRAANQGPVAKHGNRQILKPMLFQELGKSIEQGTIGFLDAKVHPYRHPQGVDSIP